ncbi:ankyrin repeat and SOCS box protein 13-like isoform X2 [Oratosquilla oratoria]|uniref:ankyrin repeat and SOCS box protein 13-like isoform X2 n=1 Tax=Oratosquilla oratoria TaxID=337810 RepID=UPI003F76DCF4
MAEHHVGPRAFPLHEAVAHGDFAEVKRLIASGFDINQFHYDRVTPLHVASLAGKMDIVRYLVENGALVNANSIDNSTPLCDACAGGSVEVVQYLLDCGAQVNPPLLLSTPLHEAALRGNTPVVALLVDAGARLTASDLHYGTPLHAVCSRNNPSVKCIQILLQAGAHANALKTHRTPLHLIAMNSNSVDAASVLLEYGANIYLKDGLGRRPRDLSQPGSPLAELLAQHEQIPPSLSHCCRLVIRASVGPKRLRLLTELSIPTILMQYLKRDVIKFSLFWNLYSFWTFLFSPLHNHYITIPV